MKASFETRLRRTAGKGISLLLFAFAGGVSAAPPGTILDSKHDFSSQSWTGGQICVVCHIPHYAGWLPGTPPGSPLWNHSVSDKVYGTGQLYASPTLNATPTNPTGITRLCLSCHDGTLAIDAFGGRVGGQGATHTGRPGGIGADAEGLSNDHPVSFTYDQALVAADGGLRDPTTRTVTIGSTVTKMGTVQSLMLFNNEVHCASCHDVHDVFTHARTPGEGPLMKVSLQNKSELCRTCHIR